MFRITGIDNFCTETAPFHSILAWRVWKPDLELEENVKLSLINLLSWIIR